MVAQPVEGEDTEVSSVAMRSDLPTTQISAVNV
jgi:hypothetical protein